MVLLYGADAHFRPRMAINHQVAVRPAWINDFRPASLGHVNDDSTQQLCPVAPILAPELDLPMAPKRKRTTIGGRQLFVRNDHSRMEHSRPVTPPRSHQWLRIAERANDEP